MNQIDTHGFGRLNKVFWTIIILSTRRVAETLNSCLFESAFDSVLAYHPYNLIYCIVCVKLISPQNEQWDQLCSFTRKNNYESLCYCGCKCFSFIVFMVIIPFRGEMSSRILKCSILPI